MTLEHKRTSEVKIQHFQTMLVKYLLQKEVKQVDAGLLYEAEKALKMSMHEIVAIKSERVVELDMPKPLMERLVADISPSLGDALCYLWDNNGHWKNEKWTRRLLDLLEEKSQGDLVMFRISYDSFRFDMNLYYSKKILCNQSKLKKICNMVWEMPSLSLIQDCRCRGYEIDFARPTVIVTDSSASFTTIYQFGCGFSI